MVQLKTVTKSPTDVEDINYHTELAKSRLASAAKALKAATSDSDQKRREIRRECAACFYLRGNVISGQAFSSRPCKREGCTEESRHHNTDCPAYCETCSEELKICRRCGGDLGMRRRRARVAKW